MDYKDLNHKHGVAGLNILLSVITMLFVIGILVMAFVLAGNKMEDSLDATTDMNAILSIANTTSALDDVIDWFPIFIVFAALVVLILLLVIVIISIRGAGISGEGGA